MINKINLNDEAEVTCFLQVVKTTLLLALISAFSVVNFGLILWEEKEVEWKLIENNGGLRVICKTTMIIAFLSLIASILFLVSAANFHFLLKNNFSIFSSAKFHRVPFDCSCYSINF